MDIYSATETAYKNGYEAGYKTGHAVGMLEAAKDAEMTAEAAYREFKQKYFSDEPGVWVRKRNLGDFWTDPYDVDICSGCGKAKPIAEKWAYCPACGTRMKGGENGDHK